MTGTLPGMGISGCEFFTGKYPENVRRSCPGWCPDPHAELQVYVQRLCVPPGLTLARTHTYIQKAFSCLLKEAVERGCFSSVSSRFPARSVQQW